MAKAKTSKAKKPTDKPSLADQQFTASIFITQATGIIETIIELKPIASQLNNGEIGQALYGAVDQLNRALEIVDGNHFPELQS